MDFFFFLFFFFFQLPVTDPTQFAEHLFLKHEKFEKLLFPDGVDETFGVEPKGVEQSLSQSWVEYAASPLGVRSTWRDQKRLR